MGNAWNREELNPPIMSGLGLKQKRAVHHQVCSMAESLKHRRQPNPKTLTPRIRHEGAEGVTPERARRVKGDLSPEGVICEHAGGAYQMRW